jgi:hypothetical protein
MFTETLKTWSVQTKIMVAGLLAGGVAIVAIVYSL